MRNFTCARRAAAAALVVAAAACSDTAIAPEPVADDALAPVAPFSAVAAKVNLELASEGADYVLYKAEYLTTGEGGQVGRTVFFGNVGNKQLPDHFVPGDPRRGGAEGITYINDRLDGGTTSGLWADDTEAAIGRAMDTWDGVRCSDIPLENLGSWDFDFGVMQNVFGFGGNGEFFFADVTHAGFLPASFFDLVDEDGGEFILGVTYTFVWVEDDFITPTDIDNNRRADVAFRETYYNDGFPWGIDEVLYDVETVVLHEAGHGLSQGHFGTAFIDGSGKRGHFAPRALMNAGYSGVQQRVVKTDKAGHCSIWSGWPNN
jgi:hypothetical protein